MDNIVYKYFDLSIDKKNKIDVMLDVYRFWNNKVNLISRRDIDYFYERHLLHSLSIAKVFTFLDKSKIMDLGTGGGFPGVPLAIMFPNTHFTLVDSISKKTKALSEIVKELKLYNVTVVNSRAESVNDIFDFVVCRAVAKIDLLHTWTVKNISSKNRHAFQNGLICLKGGDLNKELQQVKSPYSIKTNSLSDFFEEEFFKEKKIIYLFRA